MERSRAIAAVVLILIVAAVGLAGGGEGEVDDRTQLNILADTRSDDSLSDKEINQIQLAADSLRAFGPSEWPVEGTAIEAPIRVAVIPMKPGFEMAKPILGTGENEGQEQWYYPLGNLDIVGVRDPSNLGGQYGIGTDLVFDRDADRQELLMIEFPLLDIREMLVDQLGEVRALEEPGPEGMPAELLMFAAFPAGVLPDGIQAAARRLEAPVEVEEGETIEDSEGSDETSETDEPQPVDVYYAIRFDHLVDIVSGLKLAAAPEPGPGEAEAWKLVDWNVEREVTPEGELKRYEGTLTIYWWPSDDLMIVSANP